VRVLELGWEFPPRISGGLGTACEGIVRGLRAQGVDVLLVLPRLAGGEEAAGTHFVSAADLEAAAPRRPVHDRGALDVRAVASPLRPYQTRASYDEAADAAPAPLQGGYGAHLGDEVERYAAVVGELAARERFDVVHAHDWMTFPAGVRAQDASGRPLVVHVHASEYDRCGADADPAIVAVEALGLARADRVVCVSHYTRNVVLAHYDVDPAKVEVVHNAVRRADAPVRAEEETPGRPLDPSGPPAPDRPPTVLFLGRLTRQKGPAFFLEAAGLVHAARPDVRFLVAGDGDLKASLVEASAERGLARNVFFTGFLGPEDVERAYAAADVYVMPSVSEPFGIAPLEALSLDVPVIVSRQSGVAETLPSAPKIDYWDVRDLASKVLMLLERPDLRRALVDSGRQEIAALRWETVGARLVEVFRAAQRPQRAARTPEAVG
jgi:glycogen(starch) synthase